MRYIEGRPKHDGKIPNMCQKYDLNIMRILGSRIYSRIFTPLNRELSVDSVLSANCLWQNLEFKVTF